MKTSPCLRNFLLAAGSCLLAVSAANGQVVWDGSDSNLWNNADNWVGGVAPVSSNSLTFSGTANQTNTNNLGTGFTSIGTLTLANAGWDISLGNSISNLGGITATGNSTLRGNFTVLSGGTNTFTLNGAAGTTTLTIADKLTFSRANNTATLTVNGAGNTLVLGSFELGTSNGNKTIAGTANVTVNGVVSDSLTAGQSFIWAGTGTLTLKGANNYDAYTNFSTGTVDLGGGSATGSLASTNLTLGNVVFNYSRTGTNTQTFTTTTIAQTSATTTIPGGAKIIVAAGNTLNLGALSVGARGAVDFGATGTITTTTLNNSNGILGGWATIGGNWAVANGGSSAITGYTGSYSLTNDVTIQNSGAAYAGKMISVNSSQSPDAVITPSTLNFQTAGANTLTLFGTGNNTVEGIRVTTDVGSNASVITGGTLMASTSGGALNIIQNNTASSLTIGSIIANNTTNSSIVKSGDGTLIVTGNITSTGGVTIHGGTFQIGNGSIATQTIVNNGQFVINRNGNVSLVNIPIHGTGSVTFNPIGGDQLTLNTGNTYSGGFTQNGGIIVGVNGTFQGFGTGTVTVTGSSSWQTSVTATTINNNIALDLASMSLSTSTNTVAGNNLTTWNGNVTLGTNVTINQTNAASGTSSNISHIFNGNIGQDISGRSLSFSGGNTTTGTTYTLNGTNTYTGNTTTNNATSTLVIGGSGSLNSGNYAGNIITNGATFKYSSSANQTISGQITGTGGKLIKDTAASTLTLTNANNTYTGATTVSAGKLIVDGDISTSTITTVQTGATIGGSGTVGNLTIDSGGAIDLTGATLGLNSTGILTLSGSTLTLGDLTFQDLVGWDWENAAVGTYKLINGTFDITWGSTAYLNEGSAYNFNNGYGGYFTQGSLNAVIFAIPEPNVAALLGSLGVLVLLRRRR